MVLGYVGRHLPFKQRVGGSSPAALTRNGVNAICINTFIILNKKYVWVKLSIINPCLAVYLQLNR